MRIVVVTTLLALAGCASNTGVVALGQGQYMLAKQAATGIGGLGNLKGEVVQEAADHCRKAGRALHIVKASESAPPYILGNYPRAEIEFDCQ